MLTARVQDAIKDAGERTAVILTQRLRAEAVQAGWPKTSADKIVVSHSGGTFEATCVGAEDWEYGNQDRPPMSVVRIFNTESHREADNLMTQALSSDLADLL